MSTQVRRDATLINICAVPLLSCQGKPTVAATFKAANGVTTSSMSAYTIEHLALIHIFVERPASKNVPSVGKTPTPGTDGLELRRVLFRTLLTVDAPSSAHQTAAHVNAVSAWQWRPTFILMPLHVTLLRAHVNTGASSTVQSAALGTLTAERALGVHTAPICTDAREHLTLINVFTDKTFHTSKSTRAGCVNFTGFTGAAPSCSQSGTTLRLKCGSVDVDFTAVVLYGQPTGALHTIHTDGTGGVQFAAVRALAVEGPSNITTHSIDARTGITLVDILAGLRVRFEDKAFGTRAGVGAGSVSAQAIVTQQPVHQTLIDINTVFATGVGFITNVTDAAITSSQILTDAILTNIWIQGALIDISAISCNTNTTATNSLEFS